MLKLGETTTIGQIQSRYFLSPKQPLPYKPNVHPDVQQAIVTFFKVVGKL